VQPSPAPAGSRSAYRGVGMRDLEPHAPGADVPAKRKERDGLLALLSFHFVSTVAGIAVTPNGW
jgi:hypothetical protein